MNDKEKELKSALTGRTFDMPSNYEALLEEVKSLAVSFVRSTEGIAVISDFCVNDCHIYSGRFGMTLMGLPEYSTGYDSAFEDIVFSHADADELLERHILELHYFNYLKDVPPRNKSDYQLECLIRFNRKDEDTVMIYHTSHYVKCDDLGKVLFGLCTYVPSPLSLPNWKGDIINIVTGETISPVQYDNSMKNLLSKRQKEILRLLAKGISSKQIADQLNISLFTVNRHRQDILTSLRVANTAAAVEIGLRMKLI